MTTANTEDKGAPNKTDSVGAIVVGCAHLSDDEFVRALDQCRLPLSAFRHGDHLRLAWIWLHRLPFRAARKRIRDTIRKFGKHHGKEAFFHETVTGAWIHMIASHDESTFPEFLSTNGWRLTKELLHVYYSPSLLACEKARSRFVEPDIRPFPLNASGKMNRSSISDRQQGSRSG